VSVRYTKKINVLTGGGREKGGEKVITGQTLELKSRDMGGEKGHKEKRRKNDRIFPERRERGKLQRYQEKKRGRKERKEKRGKGQREEARGIPPPYFLKGAITQGGRRQRE